MEAKQKKQWHVLVVEDEERARKTLELVLRGKKFRVSSSPNGRRALEVVSENLATYHPVDLVVTDIQMPDMTGLELVGELHKWNIHLPILVTTAYGDKPMLVELMRMGCTDYLDKPYQTSDLLERIRDILGISSKKKEDVEEEQNDEPDSLELEKDDRWTSGMF